MISSYRPYFSRSEILSLLQLRNGREEFEKAVAERTGARYGLAFAYGRSGLIALFKSLGLSEAEVVMPAYTCEVMAKAVIVSGNKPVFVDIDLTDYNMNISAIKKAITPHTRAVIATHMYGYPTDVATLRREISDDRILIIEDAALALQKSLPGTTNILGDVALYSFGRGKQLYTITGGVIVTNSANLYDKLKSYRDQKMNQLPRTVWVKRHVQILTAYMAQNGFLEEKLVWLKNLGAIKQTRAAVGLTRTPLPQDYASAYADFQGRIGLAQLGKLEQCLERCRELAEFYNRNLQDIPHLTPAPVVPGATYTYYSVRIPRRDEINFRQQMRARGVEVGANFSYILPNLNAYQKYANGEYPGAEQAAREVVNLPNYPGLKQKERQHVVECIRQVLQR